MPTPFDPAIRWEQGGYIGRFLPRDDARVGFFGNYTNCCQHWEGVGKSCAVSTVADSFSQLFVIEKNGEIIAGSWAWEAVNSVGDHDYRVVCFDNVEAKGLSPNQHNVFADIYQKSADWLCANGYRKVTIGKGLSDLDLSRWPQTNSLKLPTRYSGYTDAGTQVLVAENQAAPGIHAQQAKVWVRGALEADFQAAEAVAAACYPGGWNTVSFPDSGEPQGLVLMHQNAGVIGYVIWDQESRYVTDIAVLHQYRRHAPKLIDAVFERCKDNEWWSGDFRESTSFRTIQRYAQRGRVEIQVGDVSHYIGDEPCYQVRFRVL